MRQGNIIFLNGTSSSGKSSIAEALQDILEEPYLHTGVDHFFERFPKRRTVPADGNNPGKTEGLLSLDVESDGVHPASADGFLWVFPNGDRVVSEILVGPLGLRLTIGMYHAIAAFVAFGNDAIVDDVVFDPRILQGAVAAIHNLNVLFVGVRCPLALAEQRERERGDRVHGLVKAHYELVHAHGLYDLEVDTSLLTPAECAKLIKERLCNGPAPDAFSRLYNSFSNQQPN